MCRKEKKQLLVILVWVRPLLAWSSHTLIVTGAHCFCLIICLERNSVFILLISKYHCLQQRKTNFAYRQYQIKSGSCGSVSHRFERGGVWCRKAAEYWGRLLVGCSSSSWERQLWGRHHESAGRKRCFTLDWNYYLKTNKGVFHLLPKLLNEFLCWNVSEQYDLLAEEQYFCPRCQAGTAALMLIFSIFFFFFSPADFKIHSYGLSTSSPCPTPLWKWNGNGNWKGFFSDVESRALLQGRKKWSFLAQEIILFALFVSSLIPLSAVYNLKQINIQKNYKVFKASDPAVKFLGIK